MNRRLAYATWGYTTHDLRFVRSAVDGGWEVVYLRCDGGAVDLCADGLPRQVHSVEWIGTREHLSAENHHSYVREFAQLLDDLRPDLVHAGPVPTVAAMAVDATTVPVLAMSWASDLLIETERSPHAAISASRALKSAGGILVDSAAVAARAIELGADPERIITVPWGVDLSTFATAPCGAGEDRPVKLLCLRSFESIYDVATLLRAFRLVLDRLGPEVCELHLAGSGSLEASLRDLAAELEIEHLIHWLGRVSENRVRDLLASCDVHVSPALSDGSSISLLQAMATGRPSIVTDIPSNNEWVTRGDNGWLFRCGDADSLARAVEDAILHRSQLGRMGASARTVAESRADWEKNRRKVLSTYQLLSATVAGRPKGAIERG